MSDPYDPYRPNDPADSFRVPESDFRVNEADAFRAPEPPPVPEPLLAADPMTTVPLSGPIIVSSPEGSSLVEGPTVAGRVAEEVVAWLKTLASAAVYATLIVTFGFQVARVEGQSMAPTLADQDRLIVNKAAYRFFEEPQIGDIVMLYYPLNPDKSFVKRVIAEGRRPGPDRRRPRLSQRRADQRRLRARGVPEPRRLGPRGRAGRAVLRDGRSPEQQLRQPSLAVGAEEVHHRQGAAAVVAAAARADLLKARDNHGAAAVQRFDRRPIERSIVALRSTTLSASLSASASARPDSTLNSPGRIANFLMRSNCASSRFSPSTISW